MNGRAFWAGLTPGVKGFLLAQIFLGIASWVGMKGQLYFLPEWLAVSGHGFWPGRVWTVVTHPLLPSGLLDFFMQGLALCVLGPRVERVWSKGEFWSFVLVTAVGTTLAKLLMAGGMEPYFSGAGGVTFGLLAAWAKLFGGEDICWLGIWQTTVRKAVLASVGVMLVLNWANFTQLLVPVAGGMAAWLYLALRWRMNAGMRAETVKAERMSRLEF